MFDRTFVDTHAPTQAMDGCLISCGANRAAHPGALDAVKHWRYQPTLPNPEAVEVLTEIGVHFTLNP